MRKTYTNIIFYVILIIINILEIRYLSLYRSVVNFKPKRLYIIIYIYYIVYIYSYRNVFIQTLNISHYRNYIM